MTETSQTETSQPEAGDPADRGGAGAADWASATEQQVLQAALSLAPEIGWTSVLVRKAGAAAGLTGPEAELLLPNGPRDLAALLAARLDDAAASTLSRLDPTRLKIRERISAAVQAWIDAAVVDEPAVRRWAGYLTLPQNLALGARLYWASADRMWRWAGDAATDENHYSKRAILSGLLTSTLAVRLAGGPQAAAEHLARGIDAVMSYERLKGRLKARDWAADIAGALGRFRYGGPASHPASQPDTDGAFRTTPDTA